MTATDELRRLLDERGVEYLTDDGESVRMTKWSTPRQGEFMDYALFVEFANGKTDFMFPSSAVTPEQAIAATLGSEREKQLKNLLRDACWLITRAAWPTESVDEEAADWYTHIHAMGIEVD